MGGIVRRLLSFLPFAGTRQKDVPYETFLHSTVQDSAELSVIEFMLDTVGADISAQDENGAAPLHIVARLDHNPGMIEVFINGGADIQARADNGSNPHHWAARNNGGKETVGLLLEYGADVNALGADGATPLHNASAFNELPEVPQILIDRGSNINAKTASGLTPYTWGW